MPFTTAITKAIQTGDIHKIKHLIKEEKAWDTPNEQGLKPIHVAIDYGHLEVVDWLLKNGVSLECATARNGSTALHRAAFKGQTKIISYLLKVYQDNPKKMRADGVTPLHFAAQKGYKEIVALLLEHGADIGQADNDGVSPLYMAAQHGHSETVMLLLNRRADIHQATNDGASPLFVAAQQGHTATVAIILDHHADIRQSMNDGRSPLYVAAAMGHTNTVILLLESNADIKQANNNGTSPLFIAAQEGHTATVALLLDRNADIQQTNSNGASALFIAAQQGHKETVALLLERHADINQENINGVSPLYVAAQNGHIETVVLLLDHHADIRKADKNGACPIFIAAAMGHTDTVALLLDRNADILQANNNGASPLYIAAQEGHIETVALLLSRYADIRQTANDGRSPLFAAARMGNTAMVKLLLNRHADIQQTRHDNASPLYGAAEGGHTETVALLLDHGADICQVTNDGTSPLIIAAQQGHTETVSLLLERYADIRLAANNGECPLFVAAYNGHTETVAFLLDRYANIRQSKNNGISSLFIAAQQGHTEIVKLLLDRHADIQQANNDGASPLYIAAQEGHPETVTLLLKYGAPLEQVTLTQHTPLWIAAFAGHAEVVQILLTNHALMTPDDKGDTPLHIAIKQGNLTVVKILILHSASVNTLNTEKQTPLMLAARSKNTVMFGCLLAAWFQQQTKSTIQSGAQHQQNLERKKVKELIFSYKDINTYKIMSMIADISQKNFHQWILMPPKTLTLAKNTRQSLNLQIGHEQVKLDVKLGEGAFGEVFLAVLPFGPVALKRIKLEKIAEWFKVNIEEAQTILHWEISQLEKVRHPHVIELLSVLHSNTSLLVMELCDTTLDKFLPQTPYSQWQVAWEVACGLAYLHSLCLVHRDIKPKNILLKDGIAKISDMGLAQIDPLLIDKAEPRQLQSLIGDIQWASPEEKAAFKSYHHGKESIENIKKVCTAAADMYSYGLVLANYTYGLELKTFDDPILRPIIEACLQTDPKHRPSALQVLTALENNIPHSHPVLAKLCQRLGILAHYHQHELAHFLIPWVSPKPEIDWLTYQEGIEVTGSDAPQPFSTLWHTFLVNSEKRLLDIRGAGGLGKTLLGYHQLKEQWQALRQWLIKPQGDPPTLVLLLTPDYLETCAFTLEDRLAEIYQLDRKECETLKQYPVVFLCDSEDEWQARPQLDLSQWPNAKAWIIGRPSARAKDSVYLLPFNQVQIVKYLRQNLIWDETNTKDFIAQLPISAIKEVLRNPFVLSIFRLLWPIPDWQQLTKEAIYHRYFTQFIERQQKHWLTSPYSNIYEKLISYLQQHHQTLAESYLSFAGRVSLQLFEARCLEGKVCIDSPWTTMSAKVNSLAEQTLNEKQKQLLANAEKTRLTLQQYQAFALAHLNRFVLPAPLELSYYRFRHKSLFEYAWAYSALLPNRPLEEDQALLTTYALIHQKEKLDFTIIDASKKDPTLSRKAGNLLTLYNWARLPLTYNYQNAHIENANLAYANLIQADFRNTQLNNCYFAYACIEKARFDKALDTAPQHNRAHAPLFGHNNLILYSALSPNGQLLATIDKEQVFIWHHQQRVRYFITYIEAPTAFTIDDTGAILIGDQDGYVYFYLGDTRQRKLRAHPEPILGTEFISEDRCWVGGATYNTIYHRNDYIRERQWRNVVSEVTCSAFHSLSWQHTLGTQDGGAVMHNIKKALVSKLRYHTLHRGANTVLRFSLTGNLVTGGEDGRVYVFKKNNYKYSIILYSTHPILSLHWSLDSQILVAITLHGFKVWNVHGKLLGNFKATAVQAIYLKNSDEGILVEKSGNLYGIALKNGEISITWFIAGQDFQGGIAIQSINEARAIKQTIKEKEEEKIEEQHVPSNQILLTPALQQQSLFADRNQSSREQVINFNRISAQETSSSTQPKSHGILLQFLG